MPTGYTYPVADGKVTEFRDFALQCARAFGACIMMRDDPMDAEIPEEFEPSDYHSKAIAQAKSELSRLMKLTADEIAAESQADYEKQVQWHEEYAAKIAVENDRIKAMLAKVRDWQPPSSDHNDMKRFMLEQLEMSISKVYSDYPKAALPDDWLRAAIAQCNKDIQYHTREHAEEVERTEKRNEWIRLLRESLT